MPTHRFALTALAAMACHVASANTDSVLLAQAIAPAMHDTTTTPAQSPLKKDQGKSLTDLAPEIAQGKAPSTAGTSKVESSAQNAEGKASVASTRATPSIMAASGQDTKAAAAPANEPEAAEGAFVVEGEANGVRIMRGTDRIIAPPRLLHKPDGTASTFKFEEAPISEIVHVMLGEILKVDYVLHQPVAGNVTLATRSDVPADQAVFLLESALQANGIVMARDARGVYHVGKPEALKGIVSAPRVVGYGALPPGSGAVIVPLQYIGAAEMATILRPMIAPDALLRVDTLRNLLVLGGTRTQAEGWLEIINTFDVNLLKGMSVGIFPLKHATVREVEQALRLMTGGGAAQASSAQGSANPAGATPSAGGAGTGGGAAAASAQAESNPFFGAVRIMPIERISSILVVSSRASNLDEARKWIERFDRPSDNSTDAQLFVYPVQNGSAKHLATVISNVFGGGAGGQAASTSTGVAPGLGSTSASTSGFGLGTSSTGLGGLSTANRGLGSSQSGQNNQSNAGVTAAALGQGGARVIADEVNNAILVYATRSEYQKIESTLRRLDVRSAQVLIEATLIEVTLKDELAYGLQWAFNDSRSSTGYTGRGVLSTVGGGVLGTALKGFSYTLSNAAGDVRAVLNALADKSLVKMLSSPTLMVLDNQTASIVVGNQQPIKSGETVATTGTAISTSIQYKDTGVSLAFTPSINAGNIVTMLIKQSVTDVGDKDDATGQRAFLQRQLESKVAIRSGETLVLGGLIRDNVTTTKSGIPLLQDIPVLGAAFRNTGSLTNRTELLVILTPRVVRSDEDTRELTDELRNRMQSFSSIERLDPRFLKNGSPTEPGRAQDFPFSKGTTTP